MGRASATSWKKKAATSEIDDVSNQNADVLTRKRLKKLAISNGILSESQAKARSTLSPSKTVIKHHGKDIIRKSQRKNRFLFSFPGLIGPIGGGKIGELKDLGTKNPILYLHFPQGQMKLFGTIVYPKNRYLTLQFSRGGKNAMCEDYFDNMIVFSDAWWIGKKEENPEEAQLDFPKELTEGKNIEYDFKGGAGVESASNQVPQKSGTKYAEEQSTSTEAEDDDDEADFKDLRESSPVRHSERTAGKTFKFTEVSSGDDSANSDADISKEEEEVNDGEDKEKDNAAVLLSSEEIQGSAMSEAKPKQFSEFSVLGITSKVDAQDATGSLVQSTISTIFKKIQEKKKIEKEKAPRSLRKATPLEDSGKKLQHTNRKRKMDKDEGPKKKVKLINATKARAQTAVKAKKKVHEVEEDDIEEFSSSSQNSDGSDENWEA